MSKRRLHTVHILIRNLQRGKVCFLVYPHETWMHPANQRPYLSLPCKTTVKGEPAAFLHGTSVEQFVDDLLLDRFHLPEHEYAIEQELEPAMVEMPSPTHDGALTHYTIYPVDVWVNPAQHEPLRERVHGQWLTCEQALEHPQVSPTARAVFELLVRREAALSERYQAHPEDEHRPEAAQRLLTGVPERPSMDALAKKWLSRNKSGVRHLTKGDLDEILDAGNRAFNLRVADPYLRYQLQGVGFTWSFFTHKDRQDTHVHGAPVVEIYGVLEGRMEIWWKPYYDRGTSAWSHRVLEPGDWAEVDSLQCHIVHWLGPGRGMVVKAGPGALTGVGRLGEKGKTPCADCPCMKPPEVIELERRLSGG